MGSAELDALTVLHLLHRKPEHWSEEMMSDFVFPGIYDELLTPKERLVVDFMIRAHETGLRGMYARRYVRIELSMKPNMLEKCISRIKSKYRNGMDTSIHESLEKFLVQCPKCREFKCEKDDREMIKNEKIGSCSACYHTKEDVEIEDLETGEFYDYDNE